MFPERNFANHGSGVTSSDTCPGQSSGCFLSARRGLVTISLKLWPRGYVACLPHLGVRKTVRDRAQTAGSALAELEKGLRAGLATGPRRDTPFSGGRVLGSPTGSGRGSRAHSYVPEGAGGRSCAGPDAAEGAFQVPQMLGSCKKLVQVFCLVAGLFQPPIDHRNPVNKRR